MNFPFFGKPTSSKQATDAQDELEKLLSFTKDIINREDIVKQIYSKYENSRKQDGEQKTTGYIQTYLALEQFIISNKPLIVKKEYNKQSLREIIRNNTNLKVLPEALRLLFLTNNEYLCILYKLSAQKLASYISNQSGAIKLQQLITEFNKNNKGNEIYLNGEELVINLFQQKAFNLATQEVEQYYTQLILLMYNEIATAFGVNSANDVIQKDYESIKDRYDYETITNYLKIIPNDILDKERVAYMTREDLEKQATLAAEEKIRRETLEKSSKELLQTVDELQKSKDTVVNLLYESQKLEKDLRTERDRVSAIISSMNEGLFVVNTEYKITLMNHSAVNLLHLSEEGFLGRDLYNLFPIMKNGKIMDRPETPLAVSLSTGKTVVADTSENLYYSHQDGLKFPLMVSTAPLFDAKNTIVGAVLVFRDITETVKYEQALKDEKAIIEQKVAEQTQVISKEKEELEKAYQEVRLNYVQAQKSEAKLRASIKNLTIGFILTHTDDRISSINNAARQLLQLSDQNVELEDIDKKFSSAISLKEKLAEIKQNKSVLEYKECQVGEKFFHIVLTPVLLADESQEYIGSVIIIEDITESKMLEKTKDEFFAIASHDLRTPLTAIRGYTSLIQTSFKDKISDERVMEMINNIDISAVRLIDLVNEYLNVTRMDNGKLTYQIESFSLIDLITDTQKEIETLAQKKNLYINVENKLGENKNVYADREKTKQIITNLIGNAIKFTEQGGITITLTQKDMLMEIRVTDTGKGIPPSFRPRMFKQFQLEGSKAYVRDTSQGSGLGLYISKRLVENMGGTIILESSEEHKGSTFLITLPSQKVV